MSPPIALTVAGSESGGGAGMQADLKTFEALGCYGTSVVTSVTASSTVLAGAVHEVPAALVREQLRAVLADLPPSAVKIGRLATVPAIRTVAPELTGRGVPVVLDPRLLAADGSRPRPSILHAMVRLLLPVVTLITPDPAELELLTGREVAGESDVKAAARALQQMGAGAVLVTSRRRQGERAVDGFLDGRTWLRFESPVPGFTPQGAGCTLSSAVTAYLARGESLPDAVEKGVAFLRAALENAPGVGAGSGPLGHHAAGGTAR